MPWHSRDVARAHRCAPVHANPPWYRDRDAPVVGMDAHLGQPTTVTVRSRRTLLLLTRLSRSHSQAARLTLNLAFSPAASTRRSTRSIVTFCRLPERIP